MEGDVNQADLIRTLRHIHSGESITYHKGLLAYDRLYSAISDEVGQLAMSLSNIGKAILVQRRLDEGCFEYIAIGTCRC